MLQEYVHAKICGITDLNEINNLIRCAQRWNKMKVDSKLLEKYYNGLF